MVDDALQWLFATIADVDPWVRILIAGAGMLLETSVLVGLLVPGDTIVLVTALGLPVPLDDPVQYIAMLVAVIAGSLAGESLGFAIGRWFGHRLRPSRLGRMIGERNWVRAERFLERRGGVAVFISRFLPVLHSLVPLTVGMSRMRYRTFILWTLPACSIWAIAYVTAGATAGGVGRELLTRELHLAAPVFAGIIVVFLAASWGIRKVIHMRAERHLQD